MIPPAPYAEIRRLFYAEHWRIGTIATTLDLHHDTVRRAIETERFIRPGPQVRPCALDPYKAFLVTTLEQYPRLRATRLHEMLRTRGFPGSANQVCRYVRTIRLAARAEAFLRLETLPGEQAQVDWGNFGAYRVGRARRVLSCFVLVLSWSRAVYARFALALATHLRRESIASPSRPRPARSRSRGQRPWTRRRRWRGGPGSS